MSCRSNRSQMFLKIDVLRNFESFTRKHLCWSLFLIKLQAKFLKTRSFTVHLQWLLLWFLQQNNLIFSGLYYLPNTVMEILQLLSPSLYKNIHLLPKYTHLVQKFCSLSYLLFPRPNFLILSSI